MAITDQGLVGGYFIVAYISLILYGIFIAQAYEYGLHCAQDAKLMKYTVLVVTILETAHTVFVIDATYLFSVNDFGHLASLALIPWSAGVSVAVGMVITFLVQGFYIRRIYILSKRNWALTGLVGTMLFFRTPFSFATAAMMYTLKTWDDFLTNRGPLITVCFGLSLSAAVDITIAGLLIFFLYRAKTGFKNTDHLVHTLAAYAVNSGFITMLCTTLSLITFFVLPNSLVFAGLVQLSSKLYANSFLGTLNARRRLRVQAASAGYATTGNIRSTTLGPSSAGTGTDPNTPRQIQIYQETFKVAQSDHDMSVSSQKGIDSMMEDHQPPMEMVKVKHVL